MNRIVIKCPTTGKLIYTGFAMDPETFTALPVEEMDPIECPSCHKMHRWKKKDALFEREDEPNEPKKADPKKADPKKADPKKADPKKADPKKK